MKKSLLKILLPLTSIGIVPVLAVSCSNSEKQLLEKEIENVNKTIKEDKSLTAETKVLLAQSVTKTRNLLAQAKSDAEIKQIKDAFINEINEIKLKNKQQPTPKPDDKSGDNPSAPIDETKKENQVIKKLKDIFEVSEENKTKYGAKLLNKEVWLWYGRKDKNIVVTQQGKNPNWKKRVDVIFTIKNTSLLEDTQLVNSEKSTYENKKRNSIELQSQLNYKIVKKSEKDDSDGKNKTVDFEVIVEYKSASYSKDGNHIISDTSNTSKLEFSIKVPKTNEKISDVDAFIKTTQGKFKLNDKYSKKDSLKEDLKQKKIDLWYSYTSHAIVWTPKNQNPNWKDLTESDQVLLSSGIEWNKDGKNYQLANPSNPTYMKNNQTKISSKLDYEVNEKDGKFILIIKYKGAEFVKKGAPIIGNEVVSSEIEIA
ncbi:hypothetical protein ACWXVM_01775 [Mycoplasma sp. 2261]